MAAQRSLADRMVPIVKSSLKTPDGKTDRATESVTSVTSRAGFTGRVLLSILAAPRSLSIRRDEKEAMSRHFFLGGTYAVRKSSMTKHSPRYCRRYLYRSRGEGSGKCLALPPLRRGV